MSDLILSLSHYHRHIAIYIVQIINTMLGRMCLLQDLRNAVVYMYLIITRVYVWPKQVVLRENWHSSLLVKIAKHKYLPWQPP